MPKQMTAAEIDEIRSHFTRSDTVTFEGLRHGAEIIRSATYRHLPYRREEHIVGLAYRCEHCGRVSEIHESWEGARAAAYDHLGEHYLNAGVPVNT